MSLFHIQAAVINGTTYPGVVGVAMDRGWQDGDAGSDGTNQKTLLFQTRSAPSVELRSKQVGTWLSALNSSSEAPCLTLTALAIYGGLAATDGVGYASGSVHEKWTATAGLAYLTGISWSDGGTAEISIRALIHSSAGSTDPWAHSSAALPALPVPAEAWCVTGLSIGGVPVSNLKSVSLKVDPKASHVFDAGLPFPVAVIAGGPNGQIDFELDFETQNVALSAGLATGDVALTLTQYAQGGTLSVTSKIITLHNCLIRDTSGPINGTQGSVIGRSYNARPRYDGTTYPMTVV